MNTNKQTLIISASNLKLKTGEMLRRVGVDGEHLIIERGQFPVAVLIPIADYKALVEKKSTGDPQSQG